MRNFNYKQYSEKLFNSEIVSMLTLIHEYKGQQNLFMEAKPDTLMQLMEVAKIQSTDASNRIEGIYTSNARLKKILQEKTMPKNRNEKEIAGYRDALATIHESYRYLPTKSSIVLQLHRDLYRYTGSSIGGYYKAADNYISENDIDGNERIRFLPVSAWETPEAIELICRAYDEATLNNEVDPLLAMPMFILDFLCIHPFSDGNGRMSRLMTLLLLYRSDYIVGRYISLEKLINETKNDYYDALQESSNGWHEEDNDYEPFVKYILGIIIAAYRDFESRVSLVSIKSLSKPERVEEILKNTLGKITKSEISEQCPDVSPTTLQRALKQLQDEGKITKIGDGRYTSYVWNRED